MSAYYDVELTTNISNPKFSGPQYCSVYYAVSRVVNAEDFRKFGRSLKKAYRYGHSSVASYDPDTETITASGYLASFQIAKYPLAHHLFQTKVKTHVFRGRYVKSIVIHNRGVISQDMDRTWVGNAAPLATNYAADRLFEHLLRLKNWSASVIVRNDSDHNTRTRLVYRSVLFGTKLDTNVGVWQSLNTLICMRLLRFGFAPTRTGLGASTLPFRILMRNHLSLHRKDATK